MVWPEFALRNVFQILSSTYETEESALGYRSGCHRAEPTEPSAFSSDRITAWAVATGGCISHEKFCESLNGHQVGAELDSIFRETPSFGRSLARRLQDYHRRDSQGPLQLIGGGGEAVVFFDEEKQDVLKLLSISGRARFGWEVGFDVEGNRVILPGSLRTALVRYARAEQMFPTGLEIDGVATDGSFLLMRQPFILGENPLPVEVGDWMVNRGWNRFYPLTENLMLSQLSWEKDSLMATDVRPENLIKCPVDGEIYSIDFIMSTKSGL